MSFEQVDKLKLQRKTRSTKYWNYGEGPGTRYFGGYLDFELDREALKPFEAVEGDVGHVLDVGRPADLHVVECRDGLLAPTIHSARHH